MSDTRRSYLPWILLLLLLAIVLWQRHGISAAERKAEAATDSARTAHAAVDSLKQVEATLRDRYASDTTTFHGLLARWQRLAHRTPGGTDTLWLPSQVDTLPLDSIPVGVIIAVADSTIRACSAVVQTCEQRVAVATARGDSAEAEAQHWQEAAGQWKKVARGSILTLAVEATVTPSSWTPQAAADLTLGRGRLRALGRVEVEQGAQSCSITSGQDAYTCTTAGTITTRLGARWVF